MTDARLRLFVAAPVPREALVAAADAVEPIKPLFPGARWVDVANQHVTLKFLGWTDASSLDDVAAACRGAAGAHAPAELRLGALGAFPNKKRLSVLWLGLDDPEGLLAGLAGALDNALAPLGVAAEERAFTPHLTLARFKPPRRMRAAWPYLRVDAPPWTAGSIGLWRSHLSPKGARYEVVAEFPLG